ncbi:MAG: response regulator [Gammaproteobacteria bacterium]|nr:response regulator [Gammaproteobacteria bacterium]
MSDPFSSAVQANAFDLFARIRKCTVLVVDDLESMRKITVNYLREFGITHILEAANGAEALRLLESHPVTVVLSDWNMPVMNGLEFLLSVRSSPKLYGLPFMMITAETEREMILQAAQAGVSDLLVKPFPYSSFAERLTRLLKWHSRFSGPIDPIKTMAKLNSKLSGVTQGLDGAQITLPPSEKPVERATILVVDDTPDNLQLLAGLFEDEYRVKLANNGEKALQICQSDSPPDLLLLDIMMPGMDGFDVAKALRSHPSSENIPIIFVTAMTDSAARTRGLELGAIDFVTKPIDPEGLRIRIKNFIRYIDLRRQLQADYDSMLITEQLKDDVERITRHDIKAPLAGVLGLIQGVIESGALSGSMLEQLQMAEEASLRTLSMINLSAELYKIESGRFVLNPKPVALVKILTRISAIARKTFAIRGLVIEVDTASGISESALDSIGDEMFCYSLFENLLKNACEAAPDNSRIEISVLGDNPRCVTIFNKGVVPAQIRDRFFDKFVTVGKPAGSGLGTYSARLLVEAQNGSIAMETSDETQTTTVKVTLPCA